MSNKLSLKEKLSYGLSDTAYNLVFTVVSTYLMFYYTDVAGLSLESVGLLFLIVRVLDAFASPIFGILIDRTNSKYGKARPWFLWLAIPFGIITVLSFAVGYFDDSYKLVYAYITYILLNTIFAGINVPISAMLPSLTANPLERSSANMFRNIGGQIGVLVSGVVALPLVIFFGGGTNQKGFIFTMGIFSVLSVIMFLLTFTHTRERVQYDQGKPVPFRDSIKALLPNFPWWMLALTNFVIFIGVVAKGSTMIFFFKYNMGNEGMSSLANGINAGAMIIGMLLVPFIVKKMKNRNVVLIGLLISILGQIVMWTGSMEPSVALTLFGVALGSFGLGAAQSTVFVMFADTVDFGEWKFGVRAQGLLTAAGTIGIQFGAGIAGALTSRILAKGGFVANMVQTESALQAITTNFVWIPAIAFAICMLFIYMYRIDFVQSQMRAELTERRAAQ
ncbi:Na+:melibiose symporter [Paenibacillus terrae HPL-003]|uniref:Na+:melibiose symporter n=1 Tax=Paenibacillus terrae (strain HPL-003) TaxID=985665 RepID=G7W1M7_PAETH|nr:MFS transporter [Paenibacillus terrae]AET58031.1 Na+:melibiose symporter [Paenibacillus terrae HPL-003]